jgi:RNA 3'-terminal phosphate cyclase (ATP)
MLARNPGERCPMQDAPQRILTAGRGEVVVDGSYGEGGGQILRTALALAVVACRPVTIFRIRVRRPKPGLQPQHLTVVRALATISDAEVDGEALGATELSFRPRALRGGDYRFDVGKIRGSAGSVSLLFQSVLLPLALADVPSRLRLIGGTHVPWSPTVHYLSDVFLPALRALGVQARVVLRSWGWYPAGGGEVEATVEPARRIDGFAPGPARSVSEVDGVSAVSRLPRSIAERQRQRAEERLAATGVTARIAIEEDTTAHGPGTVLFLAVPGRAGFTSLGRRGLPAERVADVAVDEMLAWLGAGASVDDHLADQLLAFLALADGASAFTCPTLTSHLRTVAWVVERFLPVRIELGEGRPARVEVVPQPTERRLIPGAS